MTFLARAGFIGLGGSMTRGLGYPNFGSSVSVACILTILLRDTELLTVQRASATAVTVLEDDVSSNGRVEPC